MKASFKPWMRIVVCLTLVLLLSAGLFLGIEYYDRENPDFGNVGRSIGAENMQSITDCEGDTGLLSIDAVDWANSFPGSIAVKLTPTEVLCFGQLRADGTYDPSGYAEKLVGGEWTPVGDIDVTWPQTVVSLEGELIGCYVDPDNPNPDIYQGLRVNLPEYELGAEYRITYLFRRVPDRKLSDELYSVTHTVTIPPRSTKRFDLAGTELLIPDEDSEWVCLRSLIIRVNSGSVPYLASGGIRLERWTGLRWAVVRREDGSAPVYMADLGEVQPLKEYRGYDGRYYDGYYEVPLSWSFDLGHSSGEYRLTIPFCENEDGTGETYTLCLHLNLAEMSK